MCDYSKQIGLLCSNLSGIRHLRLMVQLAGMLLNIDATFEQSQHAAASLHKLFALSVFFMLRFVHVAAISKEILLRDVTQQRLCTRQHAEHSSWLIAAVLISYDI